MQEETTQKMIALKVSGKEVWKNGWKEFEDFFKNSYKTTEDKSDAEEEKKLPELREGMTIAVEQTKVSSISHSHRSIILKIPFCRQWSEPETRT